MIFPNLQLEGTVQTDDKTRLDGTTTFITQDEATITLVEIEPEASAGFIAVTSDKFLDWQYTTDGTKTVTIRVTTDGSPVTASKTLEVLTPANDKLFSSDAELVEHEGDILGYLRPGRASFLDKHRAAQDRILGWLDEHRIHDTSGDRLTKADVVDTAEVNDWSKFLTLQIIFESISNAVDDIFSEKARKYGLLVEQARNRAVLRLDRNNDGTIDDGEHQDNFSYRLVRR